MAKYLVDSSDIEIEEVSGTQNLKLNLIKNSLFDMIYPVGSIYMSLSNTNPNTLFGIGTWEAIEEKFLIGASGIYTAGSTGGQFANNNIKVSATQYALTGTDNYYNGQALLSVTKNNTSAAVDPSSVNLDFTPPYLAVYMWKRTA